MLNWEIDRNVLRNDCIDLMKNKINSWDVFVPAVIYDTDMDYETHLVWEHFLDENKDEPFYLDDAINSFKEKERQISTKKLLKISEKLAQLPDIKAPTLFNKMKRKF